MLGRSNAKLVTVKVIGIGLGRFSSVKAVQYAHHKIKAPQIRSPIQGCICPAVNLNARVGSINHASANSDSDKRTNPGYALFVKAKESSDRSKIIGKSGNHFVKQCVVHVRPDLV